MQLFSRWQVSSVQFLIFELFVLQTEPDFDLDVEPDFDLDIKEDVQDECSKFGTLKHIYVDKYVSVLFS